MGPHRKSIFGRIASELNYLIREVESNSKVEYQAKVKIELVTGLNADADAADHLTPCAGAFWNFVNRSLVQSRTYVEPFWSITNALDRVNSIRKHAERSMQ